MVLIGGGIDLSVGATYALCQVIAMKMAISGNPVLAIWWASSSASGSARPTA